MNQNASDGHRRKSTDFLGIVVKMMMHVQIQFALHFYSGFHFFQSGEGRFVEDSGTLMKLIRTRSAPHIKAVFDSFKMVRISNSNVSTYS